MERINLFLETDAAAAVDARAPKRGRGRARGEAVSAMVLRYDELMKLGRATLRARLTRDEVVVVAALFMGQAVDTDKLYHAQAAAHLKEHGVQAFALHSKLRLLGDLESAALEDALHRLALKEMPQFAELLEETP